MLYVILQWAALMRMRGSWHVAAMIPAMVMGAALGLMAVGIAAGASLPAAVFVFALPAATAYLAILWPLHLALGFRES